MGPKFSKDRNHRRNGGTILNKEQSANNIQGDFISRNIPVSDDLSNLGLNFVQPKSNLFVYIAYIDSKIRYDAELSKHDQFRD